MIRHLLFCTKLIIFVYLFFLLQKKLLQLGLYALANPLQTNSSLLDSPTWNTHHSTAHKLSFFWEKERDADITTNIPLKCVAALAVCEIEPLAPAPVLFITSGRVVQLVCVCMCVTWLSIDARKFKYQNKVFFYSLIKFTQGLRRFKSDKLIQIIIFVILRYSFFLNKIICY